MPSSVTARRSSAIAAAGSCMGSVATGVIRPPEPAANAASASFTSRQNPAASPPSAQYMNNWGAAESTAWPIPRWSIDASRAVRS